MDELTEAERIELAQLRASEQPQPNDHFGTLPQLLQALRERKAAREAAQ